MSSLLAVLIFLCTYSAFANPGLAVQAVMNGAAPCTAINSAWTPQYAAITGYWPLNGTTGAIANGATIPATIGTSGTVTGTTAASAAGHIGNGISFTANSVINVGTGPEYDYGTTSFTVSFWSKTPTGVINPQWWMGKGNAFTTGSTSGTGGWGVECWTTTSPINPTLYLSDGIATKVVGSGSVARGVWYHTVVRIDQTAKVASIFVNGRKGTVSISTLGTLSYTSGMWAALSIGRGASSYANATLNEVAIWNVALSDAEIAKIYATQSCANN